jgi:hypothetical protein
MLDEALNAVAAGRDAVDDVAALSQESHAAQVGCICPVVVELFFVTWLLCFFPTSRLGCL